MMRRYDIYGFRDLTLEEAAMFVERALDIRLTRRDSSYRGIYYSSGPGAANDLLLQTNDEGSRWHSHYPQYGVTLMVNNLPAMDAIQRTLTAGRSGPDFLRSIIQMEEPPAENASEDDG